MPRWSVHPVGCAALALHLVACGGERPIVGLPDVTGFAAMLVDRHDGGPLLAVPLPEGLDALAIEVPEATSGSLADVLLYRAPLAALELPVEAGLVERAAPGDVDADPIPAPDRALSLSRALAWGERPAADFAALRMRPLSCAALSVHAVSLPGVGSPRFMAPWGEREVVVAGPAKEGVLARMFVVSPEGARQVFMPEASLNWRGAVDELGRVWIARTTTLTRTGTAAVRSAVLLDRLDATLSGVEYAERVDTPLEGGFEPWRLAVRARDGRAEVAASLTSLAQADAPWVLTWREGDRAARALPWPTPELALPNPGCRALGVYRTFLGLGAAGELDFVLGDGALNHWRGGALTRERLDADACGASMLDERADADWAIVDPTTPPAPDAPRPRRVYRRRGADWALLGEAPDLNALSTVRYLGRVWSTAADGRLYQLDQRRDGPLRVCPPITVDPISDRLEALLVRGDSLVAAGPHRAGNPWQVYWLARR